MADAGNGVKDMRENAKDTGSTPLEIRKKTLRASLFKPDSVSRLQAEYKQSQPYQHLVIPDLMDDEVLHGACEELKTNMQATLKETDIFKVGGRDVCYQCIACAVGVGAIMLGNKTGSTRRLS